MAHVLSYGLVAACFFVVFALSVVVWRLRVRLGKLERRVLELRRSLSYAREGYGRAPVRRARKNGRVGGGGGGGRG